MKAQKILVISLAALGLFGVAGATLVAVKGTSQESESQLTILNPASTVGLVLATDVPVDEDCGELYAQQAGPRGGVGGQQGGGQQGGPPQGGPGGQGGMQGGMRGGAPQGPMILRDPKVQKELKLSEDQIGKIQAALQEMRPQGGPGGQGGFGGGQGQGGQGQGGAGGGQGRGGQGGTGGGQAGAGGGQGRGGGGQAGGPGGQGGFGGGISPEQMQQFDAKLQTILNEGQFARYKQLALQSAGPRAFTQPDVIERLGLSEEQLDQMRKINEANRPPMGQGGPGGQGGFGGGQGQGQGGAQGGQGRGQGQGQGGAQGGQGQGGQGRGQGQPPQDPAQMQERMNKLMNELIAVLTPSQKATWQSMIGAKFEFTIGQRPGGGGQGGRPGGGGGGGDTEVTQNTSIVF